MAHDLDASGRMGGLAEQVSLLRRLRAIYSQLSTRDLREAPYLSDIEIRRLQSLQQQLTARGEWVSGPATLFGVLRLTGREVERCRVLAWMLDPLGAHALGDRVLQRFLSQIDELPAAVKSSELARTEVLVEEVRPHSRADLVLVGDGWTVVVEAKVSAGEQLTQGQRLAADWPDASYVFLTEQGGPMWTADTHHWQPMRWETVHRLVCDALIDGGKPPTPAAGTARAGIRDYLIAVGALEHEQT